MPNSRKKEFCTSATSADIARLVLCFGVQFSFHSGCKGTNFFSYMQKMCKKISL